MTDAARCCAARSRECASSRALLVRDSHGGRASLRQARGARAGVRVLGFERVELVRELALERPNNLQPADAREEFGDDQWTGGRHVDGEVNRRVQSLASREALGERM